MRKTFAAVTVGAAALIAVGLAQPASATTAGTGTGIRFATKESCESYARENWFTYSLGWSCEKDRIGSFYEWQLYTP